MNSAIISPLQNSRLHEKIIIILKNGCYGLGQGLLKIWTDHWTDHSHWFLLNQKPLEISWQKFQHFCNLGRNEFSPNLKSVAQKISLLRPLEVLDFLAGNPNPRHLKSSYLVQSGHLPYRCYYNAGVLFFTMGFFGGVQFRFGNNFTNFLHKAWFLTGVVLEIAKWFQISTSNFHHLLISTGTFFVLNLKAIGASDLDFLPKTSKTSNGHSRLIFWATPFKFGENSFLT